jgi:hypothetical protein
LGTDLFNDDMNKEGTDLGPVSLLIHIVVK